MKAFIHACRVLRGCGYEQPLFVDRPLYDALTEAAWAQMDDLCPTVEALKGFDRGLVVAGCRVEPFVELTVVGCG